MTARPASTPGVAENLLRIDELVVGFPTHDGIVLPVNRMNFSSIKARFSESSESQDRVRA